MSDICETGLWVDQAGNVTDSPVTGRLLVPPGAPWTRERRAAVDAARAAAPDGDALKSDPPPPAEKAPVKKAAAKKAAARAD